MSAEYVADKLLDAVSAFADEVDDWADENVKTGGYFFDFTVRGKTYQVEVTETRQG